MGKYIDELSRNNLCVMSETYLGIYGCSCPFNYESSIVRKDEKCRFSMYQNITEKTNNIKNQDEVSFSVLYNDMFFNQYEQKFLFSFKENEKNNTIEILRVETSFPVLVELNSQQKRTMYY